MAALMTQWLALSGKEKVLEIGTGSGYQTAILAELAQEVYSIERLATLADRAQGLLMAMGYANARIIKGDGTRGLPQEAPFDRIIVTAAAPEAPLPLIEQLKDTGILLLPLGERQGQVLTLLKKTKAGIEAKSICGCVFVPLLGRYGFRENDA